MDKHFPPYFSPISRITSTFLRTHRGLQIAFILVILLQACRLQPSDDVQPTPTAGGKSADQYTNDVATKWAALQLKLTKTTAGFTPPVASRAYGYAGITMYEAVVPGLVSHRSLVN